MPRWAAIIALVCLIVCGCHKDPEVVPDIVIDVPPSQPVAMGAANAYSHYVEIAQEAERKATVGLDVRDTEGTRTKVLREMEPMLEKLAAATALQCSFAYEPPEPFGTKPHHIGWLQMSRALEWRVERCIEEGSLEAAARWAVVAFLFGSALCGGDVSDATLGFGVMDGARRAIAPHVEALPPVALSVLAQGVARALLSMPDADTTLQNEGRRMLQAIKGMQTAIREKKTDELADRFYKDSRSAFEKLASLEPLERNAFFQALIDEEKRVVAQLIEQAQVPGAKRGPLELTLSGDELKLAQQFLTAGGPWLSVRDRTLARTRLLYCTALVLSSVGTSGSAPSALEPVDPSLVLDPYTGMRFGYLPLGRDFLVYSYGIDGKDDRGDTNSERTEPDLLVESSDR